MSVYQKLYVNLFNDMTDAIRQLEAQNYGLARDILMQAQLRAEEAYIDCEEEKTKTAEAV